MNEHCTKSTYVIGGVVSTIGECCSQHTLPQSCIDDTTAVDQRVDTVVCLECSVERAVLLTANISVRLPLVLASQAQSKGQ